MTRRQFWHAFTILFTSTCSAWLSSTARANEPPGTVRYFLEFLPYAGGGQDWEADASRRIVPHHDPDGSGSTLGFGTWDWEVSFPIDYQIYDSSGNVLLDFSNTTWVITPILHLTDDGVVAVRSVYWLVNEPGEADDLPKLLAGTTAMTGPDGDVSAVAETVLDPIPWHISWSNWGYPVRISRGVFRK
jgi:hypothetical protein